MNNVDFKTVIGLEIHCQLKTKSKMFCGCSNDAEGKEPNSVVCPICLAMPGTLPVANKKAIELALKLGMALNCKIADVSKFDRKHYFYPDLPKGYQISQYDQPFCVGGTLDINGKTIRFNRIHLEEDAGKLVHPSGADYSYVDLNRAGTPLAEIVTEPDLESPLQAKEFLQKLRELLRSIGVSDADMEKGHLRCDANISLTRDDKSSPIVEIKNLNSFKFIEKALSYEEDRLRNDFVNWPAKKSKVTHGFNSKTGETYVLREKEEAKDYRYFPEPDLPPFRVAEMFDLEKIRAEIGILPERVRSEIVSSGVSEADAKLLSKSPLLVDLFSRLKSDDVALNQKVAKLLINEKDSNELTIEQLQDLVQLLESDMPSNILRHLIGEANTSGKLPSEISKQNLSNEDDNLEEIIRETLVKNPDAVSKYKSGKTQIIGFLIGEVMRSSKVQLNPNDVRSHLVEELEK